MGSRPAARATLAAGSVYLVLGVAVWWHAWSGGPGHAIATGSLDPGQNVWWLAWVPHALGQPTNPFFTRAMFWPDGVNVIANTSFLLIGLLLSPVTLLFGPVTAFTVAVTLAPAADALATFAAVRRYVSWAPAAFVGGLLYGFGPFVATDLRYGHLNLTALVFPPLLLLLLDRLLFRPRRLFEHHATPWALVLATAGLLVAEFFVSTEMLALGVITAAVGVAVALLAWRRHLVERGRTIAVSLIAALALSVAALAYPVWWYLAGPRHFTGAVWQDMARFSASLASFVRPHGQLFGTGFISGGNGDYLGIGLLLVLVIGLAICRHQPILRFAVGMAAVTALLSLGPSLHVGEHDTGIVLPAWPLLHLPLVDSVAPSRFGAFTDLFCALALAVVLDRSRAALVGRAGGWAALRRSSRGGRSWAGLAPTIVPAALAAAALVPLAVAQPWPYPVQQLRQPTVLRALARLPEGSVVREYPLVSGTNATGLVWQATAGLRYAATGGYAIAPGTDGRAAIQPPDDALGLVFAGIALDKVRPPYAPSLVDDVRIHAWDRHAVAIAVVRGDRHAADVASLLRQALGPPSLADASGWLWRRPTHSATR